MRGFIVATLWEYHGSQFLQQRFQEELSYWNRERLSPAFPSDMTADRFDRDRRMPRLEHGFIEELRAEVREQAARAPTDPDGFISTFEGLKESGPDQHDHLLHWQAQDAHRHQNTMLLSQKADEAIRRVTSR